MTTPEPHGWLPVDQVVDGIPGSDATSIERHRLAAASFVEAHRRDLFVDGAGPVPAHVVEGAVLLAARLHARRSSPAGLASYGEFGPAAVLRFDADVERLLGIGRSAKPAVG